MIEEKNRVCIICEYAGATSLFDAVWRCKYKLDEAEIKSVMRQLLDALLALHSCGIMHRDVTLSNIVL